MVGETEEREDGEEPQEGEGAARALDVTWAVLMWLIDHEWAIRTNAAVARDLEVSRSAVSRAVDALLAAKVLERRADGGLEPGFILAECYARRLYYLNERFRRQQLTLATMGAELAILTGVGAAEQFTAETQRTQRRREKTVDGRKREQEEEEEEGRTEEAAEGGDEGVEGQGEGGGI